jgi:hypothetical protein
VTIEATAMRVMLSIICSLFVSLLLFQVLGTGAGLGLRVRVAAAM